MKKEIHPTYVDAKIICACGTEFSVDSIRAESRVTTCSQCHPFYTGKHKLMDTEGRVDRFNRKWKKDAAAPAAAAKA
jgi:large subunit ribosomal protein L31